MRFFTANLTKFAASCLVSRWKSSLLRLVFAYCFIWCGITTLTAQSDSGTRQEIWPEYDLFYRLAQQHRIYVQLSGTRQRASSYSEGSLGFHYDYFTSRRYKLLRLDPDSTHGFNLWLRGGYLYSTNSPGQPSFTEHIIRTEANVRFWPFGEFMLTSKSRFDWRVYNGDFQPRFRERLNLDRVFKTGYSTFRPYFYAEYFLYPGNPQYNRPRLSGGIEFWVFKFLSFEFYYLYQFKNDPDVSPVNAIGTRVKNYFTRKPKKQKKEPVDPNN